MRRRHVSACFASLWAPSEAARSTEIEPARPPVTNLRDDRLGLLRAAAIMNHDLRSRFGKGKSACASDTARSPCDQAFPERSVTLAVRRLLLVRCGTFEKREPSPSAMGRMCENGIAQLRIWQARQHSHLYHGHDLAGFRAYHREAKNAVVACGDKRLHKALCFADRMRPKHGTHRQFCDTRFDTLTSRLAFAQPHPCELGTSRRAPPVEARQ
jgi:hypothetical protein